MSGSATSTVAPVATRLSAERLASARARSRASNISPTSTHGTGLSPNENAAANAHTPPTTSSEQSALGSAGAASSPSAAAAAPPPIAAHEPRSSAPPATRR